MSRLTDRCWRNLDPWECCGQNFHCSRKLNDDGGCINGCIVPKLYKHLAEYEDLEEQGLLLKLPCKIGTNKLYYIDDDKEIYRINGDEVSIKRFPSGQIIYDYDCCEFSYEDFGKTVFLTKEAAEKALERLEKDNE